MKVLSTDGLTKLIQLIKSTFIPNTDVEQTTEIDTEQTSEVTLATVATTGDYDDLSNKPTIPTVNNATLTITQGGTTKGTFTANASSNVTIALDAGGSSSVSYDDVTINKNSNNELQTIGVINPQTETAIQIWNGTEQQWNQGVITTWYNWIYNNSSEGINWTTEASGVSTNLLGVIYENNKFMVVGASGTILSSIDGNSWTSETSGISIDLNGVAYGNNKFIVVGNSGTILSSNGNGSWTSETSGVLDDLYEIVYGNGKFIAVGASNILSSVDGSTWTIETSGSFYLGGITYGNNMFVIVSGPNILTSVDGSTWNSSSISGYLIDITYGNNMFMALNTTTHSVLYSSNGTTWNSATITSSSLPSIGITYGNNMFIVVGNSGTIFSSTDGSTWTTETSGVSVHLKRITYGNNMFVVTGNSGTILSGTESITLSCYTLEDEPNTSSIVYSAPNTMSTLTISSVGTGTITLSDNNTYTYNQLGNQTTYQTIGEVYPNYLCNINGVGVKIGTTNIANYSTSTTYTAGTGIDITNDEISTVNMQTTTNLVTSVSASSTDAQYPSAKLFYDTVGDIETLINAL